MERNARLLAATSVAICVAAAAIGSAAAHVSPGVSQLIEHWDGAAWKVSPSKGPADANELSAVTALSAHDVWAVGSNAKYKQMQEYDYPIAAHYDGASWKSFVLPSTQPDGLVDTSISGVSGTSASDVWAVGSIGDAVIEHYDGQAWKIAWKIDPKVGRVTQLAGVAALSQQNAWAVGAVSVAAGQSESSKALIEHWNGTAWGPAASPNAPGPWDELFAVSARSPRDIWAVGDYQLKNLRRALVVHWNGTRWTQVPCPSPTGRTSTLAGVVAIGAKDAWAVGGSTGGGNSRVLIEHWNGHRWSIVKAPSPSAFASLRAVSAVSPTSVWAVGGRKGKAPLAEHWNGHAWAVAATATPAGASGTFSGITTLTASDVWAVGFSYAP